MALEVFQTPPELRQQLLKFQHQQVCYPLAELNQLINQMSGYVGAYLLFYQGSFSLYSEIASANTQSCCLPIYIGKAENPGKRTGIGTIGGGLIGRLKEHRNSINGVENLRVEDFQFKVVAMSVDLVAWGEAVLIRHFRPVWCSLISGFGIHAPGKGRQTQMRSIWDQIHPGRSFAQKLPNNPVDINSLEPQIAEHCQHILAFLNSPDPSSDVD